MFIRPVGATVSAAVRPPGHPLLRGLLRRAAGAAEWATAESAAEGLAEEVEGELEDELGGELEGELEEAAFGEEPFGEEPEPGAGAGAGPEEEGEWEAAWESERGAHTPPPVPGTTLVAELTQLADLARQGLLTPEEFTTAKARLLRG